MEVIYILFALLTAIYTLTCLVGLFVQENYLRKMLINLKVFKGYLYISLSIASIFSINQLKIAAYSLTICIAVCEGITNLVEARAEKLKVNYMEQFNRVKGNRDLKDKENVLTDIRKNMDLIFNGVKGSDYSNARKAYYEIEGVLQIYEEADNLLENLKQIVFKEKHNEEIEKDKFEELFIKFEEYYNNYT